MVPTNPYDELLRLIDEWLAGKDKLAKLEDHSRRYRDSAPLDLAKAINEEKGKIAQLDTGIASAAEQVIQSPLNLLDGRLSSPCRENLQYARQAIADGNSKYRCDDCASAYEMVKIGVSCMPGDKAIFCLFLAAELSQGGYRDKADNLAQDVLTQLPPADHQLRAAAYLVQANLCARGRDRLALFRARHAYAAAAKQLTALFTLTNQAGHRKKAKSFEALKTVVEQRLSEMDERVVAYHGVEAEGVATSERESATPPSVWEGPSPPSPKVPPAGESPESLPVTSPKIIPFGARTIPVVGEVAAGRGKINLDDVEGYARQTDESEFEYEGRPLDAKPLKGSRLAFLENYDYFATQVSGDSMNRAGISPGDYVVLRKDKTSSPSPTSGDIVAVVFRDEDNKASLKRIDIEARKVVFKPESSNPEHRPRVLPPEAFAGDNPPVAIVGIAIAVLKPHPSKAL